MTGSHHAEKISRRLGELLGGGRIEEVVSGDIITNKERIDARNTAANQAITLAAPEPDKCLEACAEIIRTIPGPLGLIGDDQRHRRPQRRIIFDHDYTRINPSDGFPNPVVVIVDIDAEQIDFARGAASLEQRIDVFGEDKCLDQVELAVAEQGRKIAPDARGVLRTSFDPESVPALDEKFDSIAFNANFNAELDEAAIGHPDPPEYLLDDSVLVALRVNLEAITQQALRVGVARLLEFIIPVPLQLELPKVVPPHCIEFGVLEKLREGVGIGHGRIWAVSGLSMSSRPERSALILRRRGQARSLA